MTDSLPQKSPELLQAEAAAFVAENPLNDGSAPTFQQRLADVDLGVSEAVELSQAQQEAMAGFLRARGPDYAPITRRVELLRAYDADFAQTASPIVDELAELDLEGRRAHPAYYDEGYRCGVFRIEHDGQQYAIRLPWPFGTPGKDRFFLGIDRAYIRSGLRTMNVPNLEQLVAISYAKNVTVSEIMPGENLRDIDPAILADVTEAQMEEFIDTLSYVNIAGLGVDPRPPNFFYDREEGFGIIDMIVRRSGPKAEDPPYRKSDEEIRGEFLAAGARVLGELGSREVMSDPETRKELEHRKALVEAALPLLEMYKAICERRFDGEVMEAGRPEINGELVEAQLEQERYERLSHLPIS